MPMNAMLSALFGVVALSPELRPGSIEKEAAPAVEARKRRRLTVVCANFMKLGLLVAFGFGISR